jgi:transposase InsO family protein
VDVLEPWKEIKETIDSLSKFTHVNDLTFDITDGECEKLSEEALGILLSIFNMIEDTRNELHYKLASHIDITYIPMANGFVYLVAIMDWYSRKVLAWRVSNTMESDFCVDALEEAIRSYGAPEIFNTDQGTQFTSEAFTGVLKASEVQISMDGKGRWVDNVFVERLWRSVKYEEVYLRAYDSVNEARIRLGKCFQFYNTQRKHQSLGKTPDQAYLVHSGLKDAA